MEDSSKFQISTADTEDVIWFCPGCKILHSVPTRGYNAWKFDGNMEAPTIAPSILVLPHIHGTPEKPEYQPRCHSFIRKGNIEFCGDCEHEFSGKTVPLPSFES